MVMAIVVDERPHQVRIGIALSGCKIELTGEFCWKNEMMVVEEEGSHVYYENVFELSAKLGEVLNVVSLPEETGIAEQTPRTFIRWIYLV